MKESIGFIGLGTMGKGMVSNLLKNGYEVIAYNRTKDHVNIVHQNFSMVDSPKELSSRTTIIFTCVSNDKSLDDVLFQPKGLFRTLTSSNIVVDCSTTSIEMTERIIEECKKRKIEVLDAPITGSKLGAESGSLMFMVGGKKETLTTILPVLQAMGKKIVHCGKNTNGQKTKIALNLAMALILESYYEALLLGMKNGVPREAMMEVLDNSGAKNNVASFKLPYTLKENFDPHFKLSLMTKDLHLAERELKKNNLDFPLSKQILDIFSDASDKGYDELDWNIIVKILEERAKITLK